MIIKIQNPSQVELQAQSVDDNGDPVVLDTAFVRVYHISGGSEVEDLADTALTVVEPGFYRYIWEPGTLSSGQYFAQFKLTSSGKTLKPVEDIMVYDFAKQSDVTQLLRIGEGRWKIINNQMIFYESDGVTPLLTFDLFNEAGLPTNINVFERNPV